MYAYDTVQNVLWDLAVYEPSETNPQYLRYQVENRTIQSPTTNGCASTVIALVKLKNLPIKFGTDLVIIPSKGAMMDGLRALKCEDASDKAGASQWWASAVEKLNRNLEDSSPDDTASVQNNVFGGRTLSNQCF